MPPAERERAEPHNPVVQALLRLIADRRLQPGDKIPTEQELSGALDVSRPVLREAISALETVGLLVGRKGSGRVLMPFDPGTVFTALAGYITPQGPWLLDLLAVRQVLETNLLPVAAPMLSAQDLTRLEAIVAAMEAKARDGAYFGREDRDFHSSLYRPLGNQVLQALLDLFWTLYDRVALGGLAHSQRLDETAAHHRRILHALQNNDMRRAQHDLNTHFYDTAFALSRPADGPGHSLP